MENGPAPSPTLTPSLVASCVVYSGYVYCVGGFNMLGEGSSSTYYASISSGISAWMSTTPYPFNVYTVPCVAQANYIYCIAGQQENTVGGTGANTNFPTAQVYYAPLSSSGIGSWSVFVGLSSGPRLAIVRRIFR